MTWNWQQDDWPNFTWDAARLTRAEQRFTLQSGRVLGIVQHLDTEDRDRLLVDAMSNEAITTSEIEGELLNRDSVQSSIRRQLGLASDHRSVRPAERGIGELMVDLYRSCAAPLDAHTLFNWHRMVMCGRSDLRAIGAYRTHDEPMQIISGRIDNPRVHFEAPPSTSVPDEMARFIDWFNRTTSGSAGDLPALTRAGIAHLYFESIHPFEDGNGRIGRAIAEKALAQSVGHPTLTAIAAAILIHRPAYYTALEAANKGTDLTNWLAWFAAIALEAQDITLAQIQFLIDKTKLLDRFRDHLNPRQLTVLLRVLREGPAGFKGGLSAGNYTSIAKTSSATAGRDLSELVELGAMVRTGEKRHTRYHLPFPLRPVPHITIDPNGQIIQHSLPA